jgi:hypothetical protein
VEPFAHSDTRRDAATLAKVQSGACVDIEAGTADELTAK